jgi:uncharacterized protein (TIGR02246 family)
MTMEAFERRIQILEDIEAIKDLKAAYAEACDDNYDPKRMAPLFTEDAVWEGGEQFGSYHGRDAIVAFFAGVSKDIVFARHFFVMPRLKVDGTDSATGRWYMWMVGTFAGNKAAFLSGIEEEVYQKVNGQWLFKELTLRLDFATPYEEGWHKSPFGVIEE